MLVYINQLKESLEDRLTYFNLAKRTIDSSSPPIKEIIDYIGQILSKINIEAERLEGLIKIGDTNVNFRVASSIRSLYSGFNEINKLISIIEKSKEFSSNSPFINYVKHYFSELFTECQVIFLPYEGYNYTIKSLTGELLQSNFITTYISDVIIIQIPEIEKDNIFNHVLCAHEIGHRIYRKENLYKSYLESIDEKELDQKIDKQVELLIDKLDPPNPLFTKTEFISNWKNWLEELFCDALGISLFGPAFFFATVNFLPFIRDLKSHSPSHPPLWLRIYSLIRFMKKDLNFLQYEKYFQNKITIDIFNFWETHSLQYYNEFKLDRNLQSLGDYVVFLFQNNYLDVIYKESLQTTGTRNFKLSDTELIKRFSSYIENNIPPIDCEDYIQSDISPFVYIINAGWNVYKTSFETFTNNCIEMHEENRMEKSKIYLTNLVSKSLLLSFIKRKWEENK